ncbi:metallophosphoesterase family protein [Edaphosphingomonas haloaromaticamans]|uniref:Diadenosine tetraphosphatase n=1 Tax=Edaphosphingomonas haloaromaticamans TaxID=653954 RepID=A0A1S1HKH6_9SPHN|nr:metallophosphoesterase family protein [Sphingomonas haloaromaticamans]OHT21926.1 diadenosine tetraphosphatase [Sphingomonas haloaromaticamans]
MALAPPPSVAPVRLGSVDGGLVYAIGDVHGCYDQLCGLLGRVMEDIAGRGAGRRPILIFCGDYIDRGPQSAEVLDALCWLDRRAGFELHLLKGNHEQALLDFLEMPEDGEGWLEFGGVATLASYGVAPPAADLGPQDFRRARDELLDRMPAGHLRLLQRLELIVSLGDYAFVHAGIRPGVALDRQDEDDLLWIRRDFLDAAGPHEKIIVHGHSWADARPDIGPHRIGIDTGAYQTGVLTALRLEDGGMQAIQFGAEERLS